MKEIKEVATTNEEVVSITCDRCEKKVNKGTKAYRRFEEICIFVDEDNFTSPWKGIVEDDSCVVIDLCENCAYELLKDYFKVKAE